MRTVIDIECTYQLVNGKRYPLPYHPDNKLVTVQWLKENGEAGIEVFNHKELLILDGSEKVKVQNVLSSATLLIGHNIKFDLMWLRECGFIVTAPLYDTMISEYIRARGMKLDLSLSGSSERRGLTPKLDMWKKYADQGLNTDEMPLKELIEYAQGDCVTTWELYKWQQDNPIPVTKPVETMMNEFVDVLVDMERTGTYIDMANLLKLEEDYIKEHKELEEKLNVTVTRVMGDKPFNLNSNEQLSQVIYSRALKDKALWKETFNLGTEVRNSVIKKKRPYTYKPSKFVELVNTQTDKVYRTEQQICTICKGYGRTRKVKKDGTEFKKDNICKGCIGKGCIYIPTEKVAGFKIRPVGSKFVAESGFSTSKGVLAVFLEDAGVKQEAKDFIKDYLRYTAISSYLTSFIDGIKNNTREGILHVNFNQCVTATGRLSSSNPNLQNLPRDKTFPIRRVVKSRWKGGSIIDCDLAQLEFRVAALLSGDRVAKDDILAGIDVHSVTAKVLTDAKQPTDRQGAKSHTFKPLYGGRSGTEAERAYYEHFLQHYSGISEWHTRLSDEAIATKEIISASGRIYGFPTVYRTKDGKANQFTQIVNYCVQGFATGDITPCIMIEMAEEIKQQGLKSVLILTVHDSVTADIYPGEESLMIQVFKSVFDRIPKILYNRFKIDIDIPIGYELSIGSNWSEKRKVA